MSAPVAGSITAELDRLIDTRPAAAGDLQACALFVLDAVAAIIGARNTGIAQPMLGWARDEPMTMGRRAMMLGALSNMLEMDSMHQTSAVHPGTVIVPAALAVAWSRPAGGHDFLHAVLQGAEVAIRIARAAGAAHYKIHQATATCGAFGAAYAAARLLDLDRDQRLAALGNAGSVTGGLWEFLAEGVLTKQWHAGHTAENGVVSAQLAARGLTGPLRILEGERGFFRALCADAAPEKAVAPWTGWDLTRVSYKPWPSPRHTHPAIDAALKLFGDIAGREIESVEVDTYPVALALCNEPEPVSEHAARFSLKFCTAVALREGRVDFASFEAPARERHADLSRRVRVAATDRYAQAYPKGAWGAEVRVLLQDGSRLNHAQDHSKGDPEQPMPADEIRGKACYLMRRGGVERPEPLADAILGMAANRDVPIEKLAQLLP